MSWGEHTAFTPREKLTALIINFRKNPKKNWAQLCECFPRNLKEFAKQNAISIDADQIDFENYLLDVVDKAANPQPIIQDLILVFEDHKTSFNKKLLTEEAMPSLFYQLIKNDQDEKVKLLLEAGSNVGNLVSELKKVDNANHTRLNAFLEHILLLPNNSRLLSQFLESVYKVYFEADHAFTVKFFQKIQRMNFDVNLSGLSEKWETEKTANEMHRHWNYLIQLNIIPSKQYFECKSLHRFLLAESDCSVTPWEKKLFLDKLKKSDYWSEVDKKIKNAGLLNAYENCMGTKAPSGWSIKLPKKKKKASDDASTLLRESNVLGIGPNISPSVQNDSGKNSKLTVALTVVGALAVLASVTLLATGLALSVPALLIAAAICAPVAIACFVGSYYMKPSTGEDSGVGNRLNINTLKEDENPSESAPSSSSPSNLNGAPTAQQPSPAHNTHSIDSNESPGPPSP